VVTALHVVAGCNRIAIRYPVNGGQLRAARIRRLERRFDLAQLTVENPVSVTPLVAATVVPSSTAPITVWGYPFAVRGLLDTQLRRREQQGTLIDLLNDQVRQEVARAGMPDLNAEVMLLDGGHLMPGHSGAPIIDASGRVVAIADGGLERGAVEVNWAIPAARLTDLSKASAATAPDAPQLSALFSAEIVEQQDLTTFEATTTAAAQPSTTRTSYRCGAGTLVKARSRTLGELQESADDPRALQQLRFASAPFIQDSDRFDVYQELRTGATLVVPAAATIITESELCEVRTNIPDVRQLVRITAAATPIDIQVAALAYERDLTQRLGAGWQVDPSWSYMQPLTRYDGLVANRKGNVQYMPTQFGLFPTAYAFESLVAKGGLFMGVTAVRSGITPQISQQQQLCMISATQPGCAVIRDALRMTALMSIATQLSTFPVG
jgi:hypothetical protein